MAIYKTYKSVVKDKTQMSYYACKRREVEREREKARQQIKDQFLRNEEKYESR